MHNTAFNNAKLFYEEYCSDNIENKIVLDIGSMDFNGSLKPIFAKAKKYIGLDQYHGNNVDLVGSSHQIPLPNDFADIIVCSSCFEHDNMFWVSFLEICRVIKTLGYYINAPSNGPYHAYPVDNWRFYLDSWKALKEWANYNNYNVELLKSYIDPTKSSCGDWNDSVGIFKKL